MADTAMDFDINLPFDITETPKDVARIEIKHSDMCGLLFPSGRVWNNMYNKIINDKTNNFDSISPSAGIYLSAVLEFMTTELLELSGNTAKRKNKIRIEPPDIKIAIKNDPEFGIFFETKESKSRLSVPASPFDNDEKEKEKIVNRKNPLRFWAEVDNETELSNEEYGTEHKETDNELSDNDIYNDICNDIYNDIYNDNDFINGLYYIDNYINNNEHDEILQFINNNEWNKPTNSCRIVQEYIYSNNMIKISKKPFDSMPYCVKNILLNILNDNRLPIPGDY
eukprot:460551_1